MKENYKYQMDLFQYSNTLGIWEERQSLNIKILFIFFIFLCMYFVHVPHDKYNL